MHVNSVGPRLTSSVEIVAKVSLHSCRKWLQLEWQWHCDNFSQLICVSTQLVILGSVSESSGMARVSAVSCVHDMAFSGFWSASTNTAEVLLWLYNSEPVWIFMVRMQTSAHVQIYCTVIVGLMWYAFEQKMSNVSLLNVSLFYLQMIFTFRATLRDWQLRLFSGFSYWWPFYLISAV